MPKNRTEPKKIEVTVNLPVCAAELSFPRSGGAEGAGREGVEKRDDLIE